MQTWNIYLETIQNTLKLFENISYKGGRSFRDVM